MNALRDVIERRVNVFGVSEPLVQIENGGFLSSKGSEQKLIVELPGVTDVDEAIKSIGQTPFLDFRTLSQADLKAIDDTKVEGEARAKAVMKQNLRIRVLQDECLKRHSSCLITQQMSRWFL
jgi:preprotein translocase subunit SecD